jgi:hypothetical protein
MAPEQGSLRQLALSQQTPVFLRQQPCQEGCCDVKIVWLYLLQLSCLATLFTPGALDTQHRQQPSQWRAARLAATE